MSKSILITGCSTGFGFDAAKYFATKGHTVYATMRNSDGKNKPAADELRRFAEEKGVNIKVVEMDVASDESVETAASEIGTVDVLINNAGVGYGGAVESFTPQQILEQLNVNIVGTIRTARAVLPGMRERGDGLIIQVSSIAGRAAFPGYGVYHASKWGLEGISESMRLELGPQGIDVVIVQPGPFSTNFGDNVIAGMDEELASSYSHVAEWSEAFFAQFYEMFEDESAPTDPMIVVKDFEKLIDMPAGERPMRLISGLDFGVQEINDAIEPLRQKGIESMNISDWDGAKKPLSRGATDA